MKNNVNRTKLQASGKIRNRVRGKGKETSAMWASMYKDLCLEGNSRGKDPGEGTPVPFWD